MQGWRKLHNEEFHNLDSSPGIIRMIKSGRIRLVRHIAHTTKSRGLVQTGSAVHPTSYTMGTRGSSLGLKRPGRESDHSPPTSARSRKFGSIHPLPHFMA
ncbi:hypothetical protein B7P43_G00783 [Cryptotermes secundus]|uniref:Uncharacterized protein n=1 Tax=Cryptotermes secundus TaxID=105785 RepID=A0A2J7QSI8_9NEOP|nr:hypothetical protein B7P43_G00783 [Cryptotermes secundus]